MLAMGFYLFHAAAENGRLLPALRKSRLDYAACSVDRLILERLLTTKFTTCTVAALMSSSRVWVLPFSSAKPSSARIAAMRPNAVQFMASEMPLANMVAFEEASALATAPKAEIRPDTVPSRPESIAKFA